MKLFNNKQDEPKLSPQSVALVNEIKGIIDKQDSDKNLFLRCDLIKTIVMII